MTPVQISNKRVRICLEHSLVGLLAALFFLLSALPACAQVDFKHPAPKDETEFQADKQISEGSLKHLRGHSEIRTAATLITADELDFDEDTSVVTARGHVMLTHYVTEDKLTADHAVYNLKTHNGQFWDVSGTSPAKLVTTPGILTTTNPFFFAAKSADRINDRYVLHDGYVTDCKVPRPIWTFDAKTFDIVPDDRAIAHHVTMKLKGVPVFYLPVFYRPLGKNTRSSGFLTPQIGNSSRFGFIYGEGYYWAISPSYDMTVRGQYMSSRGPAVIYDFRGRPNQKTDFDFELYGVKDKGLVQTDGTRLQEGGIDFQLRGATELAGFTGRVDYSYLSSLVFRQEFSYSFTNAIYNEVDSVAFLQRHFQDDRYTLTASAEQNQIFEALTFPSRRQEPNVVALDRLPGIEFNSRDQKVDWSPVPLWWGFASSGDLLSRKDQSGVETLGGSPSAEFSTGLYGRLNVEPHLMTNYQFHGFSITPELSLQLTDYSDTYGVNSTTYGTTGCNGFRYCPTVAESVSDQDLFRRTADIRLELRTPQLDRIYAPPKWLHLGTKLKHAVEAEADYQYVTGVEDFQRTIRFDVMDILANTNQVTFRLTNRILRKNKGGNASELFRWELAHARYLDPTFGGAVLAAAPGSALPGLYNVVLWSAELTPIPFLNGPRNYSPIVSSMRLNPSSFVSVDWRTDYDPLRKNFVDQFYNVSGHYKKYSAGVGETSVTTNPLLVPQANQITFSAAYGGSTQKGWNISGMLMRDVIRGLDTFETLQGAYNTDCCGFSVRYQRINFGVRQGENQVLFSFSLANIGTFGSLQKQQRNF